MRLAFRSTGTGAPVLLLHPIGLDLTWWNHYQAWMAEDYRAITVDLPGHGRSAPVGRTVTLEGLATSVAAVLETEAAEPAHVVGVSLGGMVAQHLALSRPDSVASLILCATAARFDDAVRRVMLERGRNAVRSGMEAVVGSTLQRWISPGGRNAGIGRRCAASLLANDPACWNACWEAIARHDTLTRLVDIVAPALVITGEADAATPPAAAAELAAALPNARLEIVPGAHHLGAFEDEPLFRPAFAAFLESVTQQVRRPSLPNGSGHA